MYSRTDELVILQQTFKALSVLSTITSSPNVFIKYFVLPDILILKGFNDVKKIGLTALGTALVASSSYAADLAVTGSASMTLVGQEGQKIRCLRVRGLVRKQPCRAGSST